MNTFINNNPAKIQLNETFARLITGTATVGDIVAERAIARAALLAREDAFARRRREWAEAYETFAASLSY